MSNEIATLGNQAKDKAARSGVHYGNVISTVNGKAVEVSAHKASGHNAYRLNWNVDGRRVSSANLEKAVYGGAA